jgi:hypothetical protein
MRLGLIASFAAGYYFGSRAGRERYEQIQRWLADARHSPPVEQGRAVLDRVIDRVREGIERTTGSSRAGPNASS